MNQNNQDNLLAKITSLLEQGKSISDIQSIIKGDTKEIAETAKIAKSLMEDGAKSPVSPQGLKTVISSLPINDTVTNADSGRYGLMKGRGNSIFNLFNNLFEETMQNKLVLIVPIALLLIVGALFWMQGSKINNIALLPQPAIQQNSALQNTDEVDQTIDQLINDAIAEQNIIVQEDQDAILALESYDTLQNNTQTYDTTQF